MRKLLKVMDMLSWVYQILFIVKCFISVVVVGSQVYMYVKPDQTVYFKYL